MGKAYPQVGQKFPGVLSTIIDITPFLLDTATLYTFTEGSADTDYGHKEKTYTATSIKCKRGYYTKSKEESLPVAMEEEDLYLFVTEPNILQKQAYILFDSLYYEIITVQQTVVKDTIVYDRGVARRCVRTPQGLP